MNEESAKLTKDQVLQIIAMSKKGISQSKISKLFPVRQQQISRILRGEKWEPSLLT